MSMELLGETFDIHGGGLDLMFPHHENEMAQTESCHGKPFSRYWLHNGLMQSGAVAAKSAAGTIGTATSAHRRPNRKPTSSPVRKGPRRSRSCSPPFLRRRFASSCSRLITAAPSSSATRRSHRKGESLERFYRLFEAFQRITGTRLLRARSHFAEDVRRTLEGRAGRILQRTGTVARAVPGGDGRRLQHGRRRRRSVRPDPARSTASSASENSMRAEPLDESAKSALTTCDDAARRS